MQHSLWDNTLGGYMADNDLFVRIRTAIKLGTGLLFGQSNSKGIASSVASGGATNNAWGADVLACGPNGPAFAACQYHSKYSIAPTSPMVWSYFSSDSTSTGVSKALDVYAASGANMGAEQTLGREMFNLNLFVAPYLCKIAIESTSVPGMWDNPAYPASGPSLQTETQNYITARQAETGRMIEFVVWQIGETDAGTPARVTSCVADMNSFISKLRTWTGNPNLFIFVVKVNTTSAIGDVAGYAVQQAAYVAQDANSMLIETADIALNTDPHYNQAGQFTIGSRVALAIRAAFLAGKNIDLGTGPTPWYQGKGPMNTWVASPQTTSPRSMEDIRVNDIELHAPNTYSAVNTITATIAAGMSQLGTVNSPFSSGTINRRLSIFARTISSIPVSKPTYDGGSATMQALQPLVFRGASSAIFGSSGVNANTTTLTIPGFTTTTANNLVVFFIAHAGLTNLVSALTPGSNIGAVTKIFDSRCNPGPGTIGLSVFVAPVASASVCGSSSVTLAAAAVGAAMTIILTP